jgi:predicted SnoaL-like aldol condensation-catalyzing enzyme
MYHHDRGSSSDLFVNPKQARSAGWTPAIDESKAADRPATRSGGAGHRRNLAAVWRQHAPGFGDGIERVKARYRLDVKPGTSHVLTPRFYVADGNFVLSVVDAKTDPPKANYDLFRIADGKIAEHWEVLVPIPPPDQRKNANDPFGGR